MTEPAIGAAGEAMPEAERIRLDIQITAGVKLKLLPPADQTGWGDEQIRNVSRELSVYLSEVYDIRPRLTAAPPRANLAR